MDGWMDGGGGYEDGEAVDGGLLRQSRPYLGSSQSVRPSVSPSAVRRVSQSTSASALTRQPRRLGWYLATWMLNPPTYTRASAYLLTSACLGTYTARYIQTSTHIHPPPPPHCHFPDSAHLVPHHSPVHTYLRPPAVFAQHQQH